MRSILHDLSTRIAPAIAGIVRNVDVATKVLGIEHFLCGAMARDFLLEYIYGMQKAQRATEDLDFGISIRSWDEYRKLKIELTRLPGYSQDPKMEQRIRTGGLYFDIVPFGAIENEDRTVHFPPDADNVLNVAGFNDAFMSAITVLVAPGLPVRVASLQGLTLLKLLAWQDRWRRNNKDATDIRMILSCCAGGWNQDRIYADSDLLETEGFEPERVAARLLGHDIGSVMQLTTRTQVLSILEAQSAPNQDAYPLVDQMLFGGQIPIDRTAEQVEKQIELLRCLRRGIDETNLKPTTAEK